MPRRRVSSETGRSGNERREAPSEARKCGWRARRKGERARQMVGGRRSASREGGSGAGKGASEGGIQTPLASLPG
eukprot:scaffold157892_cov27-Tisochrysis_lutea.AAC.1